jgi:hypothetical protein
VNGHGDLKDDAEVREMVIFTVAPKSEADRVFLCPRKKKPQKSVL